MTKAKTIGHLMVLTAIMAFAASTGCAHLSPEGHFKSTLASVHQTAQNALAAWGDYVVAKEAESIRLMNQGDAAGAQALVEKLNADRADVSRVVEKYNQAKASAMVGWESYRIARDSGGGADASQLDSILAAFEAAAGNLSRIILQYSR